MKMTSRIYGIAVKETVDYYDFDEIRIQFNQDTKHWSILSNYDNIWYNGTNYTKGQLILMFSDYTVAEYKIMAQHTEVSPYVNYMYVVTTNAEINPASIQNGKVEYVFEADPENEPYQFTCKMLINNDVQKTHTVTDVDIKNYKNKTNGQLPTLFYNLKMDWHGMNPESPYLPYSFTIISNSNYIKDGTAPRQVGDIVLQIPAGVGQPSYYHKILDETNKHEAKKNADSLPVVNLAKYKGGYKGDALVNPTGKKTVFTRETIIQKVYHDHTKVYYNGHYHRAMYCVVDSTGSDIGCWKKNFKGLAFTYADPFWFCMTTSSGFEYGGRVLESKKLVKCWKGTDPINMTLSKTTSRKKPAPDDAPYDDIIYDVVSNDVNVTVTRIRRKTHIDASGHKTTEDIQEGLPIVFDTSSSPVLCWNIEFRANNNVWTIYSKCGYIRYGGRQYPKNRSILDFNAGEEMHIEIKDETEKYEVDEVVTYTISNVTATAFIYKLWTVGTSYTLKVEKSVPGEDPEPWVTVNFYDAIYDPVIIDDIQISFDNSKRIWKLISRSDDLYYYDKKLAYGDLIAEWGLNTVFRLKDNNALKVILPNPSMDVRVKSQSNKVDFKGVDISDFIPRDLNEASYLDILVVHSVTKGVWTVTSKNDNTYVNGTRYTYNKEIFSCPDKQGMPEIDIMCQHKRDESGQPISPSENWHYFISISYDSYEYMGTMVINCKKMATAPQTGWVTIFSQTYYSREKEDPEYQNRTTMILTKENAKSMYGYIWKRDMPGPGPVTGYCVFVPITRFYNSSYSVAVIAAVNPDPNNWRCTTKYFSARGWAKYAYVFPSESKYVNRIFIGVEDNIAFIDGPNDSVKTVSNSSYNQGSEWGPPGICVTGRNSFYKYSHDSTYGSNIARYFVISFDDNGSTIHMDYDTIDDRLAPEGSNSCIYGDCGIVWEMDGAFNVFTKEVFYGTTLDDETAFFDTYDYTHTDPDTHWFIDVGQLIEATGCYNGQITWERNSGMSIGNSRYFQAERGYMRINCPKEQFAFIYHRLKWSYYNWETGVSRGGDLGTKVVKFDIKNGSSSTYMLPMYDEDYINFIYHGVTDAVKYGNKYYAYRYNSENDILEIYELGSDGSLTIKEIKNSNGYVTVPLYNMSAKYADLRVYFKNMNFKYVSSGLYECGIVSLKNCISDYNGTLASGNFLIGKVLKQNSDNAEVYVCFDNPMFDMSVHNFALDSSYF